MLIAHYGQTVAAYSTALTPARARAIGAVARSRMLPEHSNAQQALILDRLPRETARKG